METAQSEQAKRRKILERRKDYERKREFEQKLANQVQTDTKPNSNSALQSNESIFERFVQQLEDKREKLYPKDELSTMFRRKGSSLS